ncbi:hypothetical protein VP199E371_P0028 [Vibrio phage 199E37-1]|nr:hypothetical protein VP199E371_P0028 [Vibrio phage 199E37-1]
MLFHLNHSRCFDVVTLHLEIVECNNYLYIKKYLHLSTSGIKIIPT